MKMDVLFLRKCQRLLVLVKAEVLKKYLTVIFQTGFKYITALAEMKDCC